MSDGCSGVGLVFSSSLAISPYNSMDTWLDIVDTLSIQRTLRQAIDRTYALRGSWVPNLDVLSCDLCMYKISLGSFRWLTRLKIARFEACFTKCGYRFRIKLRDMKI